MRGPGGSESLMNCADLSDGYADASSGARDGGRYRVIPYNFDGKPGRPSAANRSSTAERLDRSSSDPDAA
jgi:hypothetical protein